MGAHASPRARSTRCASPPDRSRKGRVARCARLKASRSRCASTSACARLMPRANRGNATWSMALRARTPNGFWKTHAMRGLCASTGHGTVIVPSVGVSHPAISDSRVDLPEPDGPMMAVRAPSSQRALRWRKSHGLAANLCPTLVSSTDMSVPRRRCRRRRAGSLVGRRFGQAEKKR